MFIVAVFHLLDVVLIVIVVAAAVADVLTMAHPVAAVGNGGGGWPDSRSVTTDYCLPLRHIIGDDAAAHPNLSVPVPASDSRQMLMPLNCPTDNVPGHLAQDAMRAGQGAAGQASPCGRHTAPRVRQGNGKWR